MRKLLTIFFFLICFSASATNYYFSASGNDGNTGSLAAPWLTTSKFNSVFSTKLPGDSFLFRRGDTFYGFLNISRSGTVVSPMIIGAYGTGAKPVITGFTSPSSWTNLGGNVWETNIISTLPYTNLVAINGVNTAMGRTPNSGYYQYQSHVGLTQITSSNLNAGVTNWTGAELAMNIATYRIVRNRITAHSAQTLTYIVDPEGSGFQSNNQNFIIQADTRTLDQQNEWYYSPTTKKLRVYSTVSPTGVQVPTLDSLVLIGPASSGLPGFRYITFDNISFRGANTTIFQINHSRDITIQNCDLRFSGRDGIFMSKTGNANNLTVESCNISDINNNGIDVPVSDGDNAIVRLNTVTRCGMIYGEIDRNDGVNNNNTAQAISAAGANTLIEYNNVDTTGFMGIRFYGDNSIVQNNYVQNFCNLLNDGGGIYTWNGARKEVKTGIIVRNNIVQNNNSLAGNSADYCIYFDDLSNGIEAYGNTMANTSWGMEVHNAFNINIHDNTFYNNAKASLTIITDSVGQSGATNPYIPGHPNNDLITLSANIFFAKTATQNTTWYYRSKMPIGSMIPSNFTSDNNYYSRPIDNNGLSILTNYQAANNPPQILTNRNLPMWRTYSGKDALSGTTPANITNVGQLFFGYNPTDHDSIVVLPSGAYKDVRSANYSGTTTLTAFTSVVLINTGVANIAPVANAGVDKNITLPVNFVTQVGSGTDADGTVASYSWARVSGPGTFTIVSPTSATTNITNLIAGVYVFQLTVTDNLGATGSDQVTINVSPANVSPSANAGSDQAVTLPTSSVTLSGSGSDPDGTISSYLWTRISGPNTPTIVSATSATTNVTGLIAGTYIFRLTVTDNLGATGFDETQVIVSASANIAPTANAGIDQTIQLPISGVSISGSGNDPDGTISAYLWTKVSGGAATITSPTSASTTITGLVQGVYQFKLTVTDNGGLTGSDIMVVTVNPANISPAANAGSDQTITLPTSSVSLLGSASDIDGSVSSHLWTKISGTGGTITTPANYATTVTGLTAGTYVFRLTATDNQGATGFDDLTVTVNSASNVSPTANAGTDQTLTWPTNSDTLSGSGTDPDGTISVYSWTKLSGIGGTITNPASASTTITGLSVGTYQYQLQVTDNSGGTATDQIQVTVVQGTATISVTNTTTIFNNLDQEPTITTTPPGLPTLRRYNGLSTLPHNAGVYAYSIGNGDPNYTSPTQGGVFTINKATVVITASSATVNFDGLQHTITATAPVAGLVYTYDGSPTPPTAIGVHLVHITLVNINYDAVPVDVTLTIVSNPAIIFISDTDKIYNGLSQNVTVTSPWPVTTVYSPATHVNAGSYTVISTITDGIHTGADTAIMTIAKRQAILSWAQPAPKPYGSLLTTLDLNAVSDISGTWSYSKGVGTLLPIGVTGITGFFTPTDPANYIGGSVSTTISVFGVNPFLDFFISGNGKFYFIKQ